MNEKSAPPVLAAPCVAYALIFAAGHSGEHIYRNRSVSKHNKRLPRDLCAISCGCVLRATGLLFRRINRASTIVNHPIGPALGGRCSIATTSSLGAQRLISSTYENITPPCRGSLTWPPALRAEMIMPWTLESLLGSCNEGWSARCIRK